MATFWQIVRFGLVGGLATLVHIIVVVCLSMVSALTPIVINTLAFLTAFLVSGIGHAFFTFRKTKNRTQSILKFFVIAVGALLLSNLTLFLALKFYDVNIAKAVAIIVAPLTSFWAAKLWAFRGD